MENVPNIKPDKKRALKAGTGNVDLWSVYVRSDFVKKWKQRSEQNREKNCNDFTSQYLRIKIRRRWHLQGSVVLVVRGKWNERTSWTPVNSRKMYRKCRRKGASTASLSSQNEAGQRAVRRQKRIDFLRISSQLGCRVSTVPRDKWQLQASRKQ